MNYFDNAKKHFKTITRHRHEVIKNCFRAGIGLQGLFRYLRKKVRKARTRKVNNFIGGLARG